MWNEGVQKSYKDKKTDSTFSNHCLRFYHIFNNKFEMLHLMPVL